MCESLGDKGEGIVVLYWMLAGSIFQIVIKYPRDILRGC